MHHCCRTLEKLLHCAQDSTWALYCMQLSQQVLPWQLLTQLLSKAASASMGLALATSKLMICFWSVPAYAAAV